MGYNTSVGFGKGTDGRARRFRAYSVAVKRVRDLSLRTILLVGMVLLVFVPFAAILAAWYAQSSAVIEDTVVSYGAEVLRQLHAVLESYFRDLQVRAFSLSSTEVFGEFVTFNSGDPYGLYLMQQRVGREVFVNLAFDRREVQNIGVINQYGLAVAFQSQIEFLETYQAASPIVRERGDPSFVILGPWRPGASGEVVSAVFTIPSLDHPGLRGVLIVDLSWGALKRLFDEVRVGSAGALLVFDRTGAPIYPADAHPIPAVDGPRDHGARELTVSLRSDLTGWTFQIHARLSGLSGSLFGLRRLSILVMAAILALLVATTSAVALWVTRTLAALERGMAEVERGSLVALAPAPTGREIRRIHEGYNRMVGRLRELIQVAHQAELREKEMVIRALESELLRIQSQVNPHFLYNTLEVINSYAIEAGNTAISRMIASLAAVFRYSVSSPQGLVPLAAELGHLESYLSIQREVYPGLRASLRLRREDRESVLLPRLTIQPLVENAVVHGYEGHCRRVEYVGISGRRDVASFELEVRDRGRGMGGEVRAELDRLFSIRGTAHLAGRDAASGSSGPRRIGLWNVHCRLRLAFGDPYGLRIARSDRRGTAVVVVAPLAREAREDG